MRAWDGLGSTPPPDRVNIAPDDDAGLYWFLEPQGYIRLGLSDEPGYSVVLSTIAITSTHHATPGDALRRVRTLLAEHRPGLPLGDDS